MTARRVLSLVPDASEWMRFLGLAEHLVGGTAECPRRVERPGLPFCTAAGMRRPPQRALTPGDPIPRDVEHDLDAETIVRLAPEFVILDTWNERWPDDVGARLAARLGHPVEIWPWDVRTLRDALEQGLKLGRRFGAMDRAMKVMGDREAELMVAREQTGLHRRAPDAALEPVLVVSCLDPPAAAAGWAAETVDRAAVRLVTARSGEAARAADWTTLPSGQVRRVVVSLPGQSADQACRALDRVEAAATMAVGRDVICYDGRGRFDGSGPGLYDAVLDMMALFHDLPGRDVAGRLRTWTGGGDGTGHRT